VVEQVRGDDRREQRRALRGGVDPGRDLLDRRALEDVAAGAGEDRLHDIVVLGGPADDEHAY
jgi:hypothetical protein